VEIWEYSVRDQFHRDEDEGPAVVVCHEETGVVVNEHYFRHGAPHRENGPAVILRGPDGGITCEEFWQDGEFIEERRSKAEEVTDA
jgi:hypothetical protein